MQKDELLQQISGWMESQHSRSFMVNKKEQGDTDTLELQLKQITLKHRLDDADDYVASDTVLLHGEGWIINESESVSLPQNAYEIALSGKCTVQAGTGHLEIQTDRAQYTIVAVHKQ